MSKLVNKYKQLKEKQPEKIYLMKSGIFYIALDDDAKFLSDIIGLKLTNLNDTIKKCGFPVTRIEYYKKIFEIGNINYEIVEDIDTNRKIPEKDLNSIINKLKNIDFDNITYKQAFEMLQKINIQIKQICANQNGTDSNNS